MTEPDEIAAELDRVNGERRAIEQSIGFAADAIVRGLGERSAYVLAGEHWHPGVIGIVASRVVERYHRPAILIALDGENLAQGSGRSIPGFDLLGALDSCGGHLLRYGGHKAAAGLTIAPAEVAAFREAIEAHAENVLTADLLARVEHVDAVASGGQLEISLAEELLTLEPCGMGNPPVTLLVPGRAVRERARDGGGRSPRTVCRPVRRCPRKRGFVRL